MGGIQITMTYSIYSTYTHAQSKVILSQHSLISTFVQVKLEIAHKGILHLFNNTRGLVWSDNSDRVQGVRLGAGFSNLTKVVISLTC